VSFASPDYLPYLIALVAVFQFVPAGWRMLVQLAASWLFYADCGLEHFPWLLASTAVGFTTAIAMANTEDRAARRRWLAVSVVFHLGMLAAFKYAPGLVESAVGTRPEIPIGMSFYTFQVLSYGFDVARGRTPACRSPVEFALYVAFFPQIVAGPIERAEKLIPQLRAMRPSTWADLESGAVLIAWGLAKKEVYADRLRLAVQPALDDPGRFGELELLLHLAALTAVVYADFSAYSDIARGSARLFGVDLVENFRRPFVATTPLGFWPRWHISLYTWLVDYVQVPLARRRMPRWRLVLHSVLVIVLVGLWHGASWNFVLWSLANGLLVLPYLASGWRPRNAATHAASWLATYGFGGVIMTFFFTPDLAAAGRVLGELVPHGASAFAWSAESSGIAAALLAGLALQVLGERFDLSAAAARVGVAGRLAFAGASAACTVALGVPVPAEFVYLQF
jgi:D-alanyl-lipoteichoic acid acyltransferase DltB (MBOAT superfamily)